jgi:hypothetical protein
MPTTPPPDLLDREIAKAGAREATDLAVPLLQEVVNFGVAALARCLHAVQDGEHHFAVLIPYRHLLEMVDAVQVLIDGPVPRPAVLQLRSAFEALLTIEYIIKTDTEKRAFAYLARQTQGEIDNLWRIGGQYDDLGASPEQIEANVRSCHRRLHRAGWKQAHEALLALGKNKRLVDWYRVYGGPGNRAQLADAVGRMKEYNVLYRSWSEVTHASADMENVLKKKGTGDVIMIRRLRHPDGFNQVVSFAIDFAVNATGVVLRFYRPEEEKVWARWYWNEIRDRARRF